MKCTLITLKRAFKNYSNFIYYTESERVVDKICNFFNKEDKINSLEKEKFIYDDLPSEFSWQIDGAMIRLQKDEDTKRPILIIGIKMSS